jgi:hypothetical protein
MASGGFVMTENERITTASKYADGVLTCRPIALIRWQSIPLVLLALVISGAVIGGLGDQPRPAAAGAVGVFALVLSGASIGWAAGFARSQVRADRNGLLVHDRWRTRMFTWEEIAGFGVVERHPPHRWLGNMSAPFAWYAWPREATPVLQLRDGTERKLFPLTSGTRSDGWSLGDISAAEIRAALLTRYQANTSAEHDRITR